MATTPKTKTTSNAGLADFMVGSMAIGAIADAYTVYESSKMRELAYEHEAAMAVINAKQSEVMARFQATDLQESLTKSLAVQNIASVVSGRKLGGSMENIRQTSFTKFGDDVKKVQMASESQNINYMMQSAFSRASGQAAGQMGLMASVSELTKGAAQTAWYIQK